MSGTTHERAGRQTIVHHREFDAPAFVVQRAHTTAELLSQWMGPRGSSLRIEHFEARTGGSFDYVVETDGERRFWGSYHEVVAGRIVHTCERHEEPAHPTLEVLEFRALPGDRCALEIASTAVSEADADALADPALVAAMDERFERLDEALAKLAH